MQVHLWGEDELTGPVTVEVTSLKPTSHNIEKDLLVTLLWQVEAPMGKPPVFYRKSSSWTDLFVKIKNEFN